jgi:hypothetical protein
MRHCLASVTPLFAFRPPDGRDGPDFPQQEVELPASGPCLKCVVC